MCAGEVDEEARRPEMVDRVAVEDLRRFALSEQSARARLDALRPACAARSRRHAQHLEGMRGTIVVAAAYRGLDELDHRPGREPQLMGILGRLFGGGERGVVAG